MPLLNTSSVVNIQREMTSHFKLGMPEEDTTIPPDLVLVCSDGQRAREFFVHKFPFFSQCEFFKKNGEPGPCRKYLKMPTEFGIDLVYCLCETVYTGSYKIELPQITTTLQFHADMFNMAEEIGFKDLRTSAWAKFDSKLAEAGFYFRSQAFLNFLKKMFKDTCGIGDLWEIVKKHCRKNKQHLKTNKDFLLFENANPAMWETADSALLRVKCERCGNTFKMALPRKPGHNERALPCGMTGCGIERTAVEWESRAVDIFGRNATRSGKAREPNKVKAKPTESSVTESSQHNSSVTTKFHVKTDPHIKSCVENTEFDEQDWDRDFLDMKQELGDDTLARVYESGSRSNPDPAQRGSHKLWGSQVQLRRSSRISSQSSGGNQSASSPSDRRAQKRVRRQ